VQLIGMSATLNVRSMRCLLHMTLTDFYRMSTF
jgi:hypothetical protein